VFLGENRCVSQFAVYPFRFHQVYLVDCLSEKGWLPWVGSGLHSSAECDAGAVTALFEAETGGAQAFGKCALQVHKLLILAQARPPEVAIVAPEAPDALYHCLKRLKTDRRHCLFRGCGLPCVAFAEEGKRRDSDSRLAASVSRRLRRTV
jgi:hypothetical protein